MAYSSGGGLRREYGRASLEEEGSVLVSLGVGIGLAECKVAMADRHFMREADRNSDG